jgi:hypothetical protein
MANRTEAVVEHTDFIIVGSGSQDADAAVYALWHRSNNRGDLQHRWDARVRRAAYIDRVFSRRHDMQATPSIPVPAKAPRASVYWLLALVPLLAVAAAWSPTSTPTVDSAVAPPPAVAAAPAITGDTSVPKASRVSFKDEGLEEPAPTF